MGGVVGGFVDILTMVTNPKIPAHVSVAVPFDRPILTAEQITAFHERGFLTLSAISTEEELVKFREVFARLFAERAGRHEGAQYDLVSEDTDDETASLPTIINPVNYAPELRRSVFRRNAATIARQLLGPGVTPSFEHAILKPAHFGAKTPWHQDEAYRESPDFAYNQVSFWMPLVEATPENGCTQYIAGSNHGPVLAHHSPKDDPRIHAIECVDEFPPTEPSLCPLPPGGVAIHAGRTLHHAGANQTGEDRIAYILAFETPPKPLKQARDFYWNREKVTRDGRRRHSWRLRGGILIEAFRKVRLGMLNSPERIAFEVRRAIKVLFSR